MFHLDWKQSFQEISVLLDKNKGEKSYLPRPRMKRKIIYKKNTFHYYVIQIFKIKLWRKFLMKSFTKTLSISFIHDHQLINNNWKNFTKSISYVFACIFLDVCCIFFCFVFASSSAHSEKIKTNLSRDINTGFHWLKEVTIT